ncbi:hypothetical protein VNO80_28637 [Phaseolus coccineus]|uniref:Uncharacterized protein n=1 Tax=Phaseolus coccineus TaxID=3886 RepID=A0AAN9QE71_PHACN
MYFNRKIFVEFDIHFLVDSSSGGFILLYKKIVNTQTVTAIFTLLLRFINENHNSLAKAATAAAPPFFASRLTIDLNIPTNLNWET